MTAQISDTFIYKRRHYSLIGIKGGDLASPEQFGMQPEMISTACYCGFYATYVLKQDGLILRELTLREKNGVYLPIGNILPDKQDYQATYRRMNEPVPFTGKLRLARGFIDELYIHMGYQKPTAFEVILDFTLEQGRIVKVIDRSQEYANKRSIPGNPEARDTISWMFESFDLNMDDDLNL